MTSRTVAEELADAAITLVDQHGLKSGSNIRIKRAVPGVWHVVYGDVVLGSATELRVAEALRDLVRVFAREL